MSEQATGPRRLLDRVLRRSALHPTVTAIDVGPDLDEGDEARVRGLVADLLARHDTTTQRAEASAVADAYVTLSDTGRHRFLTLLARDLWTDRAVVDRAMDAVHAAGSGAGRPDAERELRAALTPPAARLLHLFTGLDAGVKLLVDLRADVLRLGEHDPGLAELDREMRSHLATLFDVGMLTLRRITWDSPASLLEKLAAYEAVHTIGSWADLKNRLDDADRRCFAFFHPAMPDEPLVFVEIALTVGLAGDLPTLLDESAPQLDPARADTAVFYSISNCQPGLAGVNLGNALIKQVVEELARDLGHIRHFVTLSPIPGFRRWLEATLRKEELSEAERDLLPAEPERVLARIGDADWNADEAIRPGALALCARYLTSISGQRALDPVANFHLANGAAIERINWMADPSSTGRARSLGIMANYVYEPEHISERAESYASTGTVAVSAAVRDLLTP